MTTCDDQYTTDKHFDLLGSHTQAPNYNPLSIVHIFVTVNLDKSHKHGHDYRA